MPSPGRILGLRAPAGPGIRDDSWVEEGTDVPIHYDSLLSKVIAWGEDRFQATARMSRALEEVRVRGISTILPFFRWLLGRPEFVEARFHTAFLDELLQQQVGTPFGDVEGSLGEVAAVATCLVEASRQSEVQVPSPAQGWKARARVESLRA
jgi:acetyl/propionyl-CoA carboxylase alpha subunit